MATIASVLARKGTEVKTVFPSTSIREASNMMYDYNIRSIVVVSEDNDREIIGIITLVDIHRTLVNNDHELPRIPVGHCMTTPVKSTSPEATVESVATAMKTGKFSHMPVLDHNGQLCGIVSIGDVMVAALVESDNLAAHLSKYINT